MDLSTNITKVEQIINTKTQSLGLKPKSIKLVAVSKGQELSKINEAIKLGLNCFGENYINEAKEKFKDFPKNIEKHFIGHLQTNKVKEAVKLFDVIQTVDSLRLAQEMNKQSEKIGKIMKILIQINISNDQNKFGVLEDQTQEFIENISVYKNIQILGLMTILKEDLDHKEIRENFRKMKNLFDKIKNLNIPNVEMKWLSMGMSDDFEIAIEEGSNMIRIGRRLLGVREQKREEENN
jgi:PLP dependent protein